MDEKTKIELAKVIASDADLKAELNLPPGANVRFLGPPILALNPATNNLTVSSRFLHHPLVAGRYFFTFPRALWDKVYNTIGPRLFDDELVEMEISLSEICGDHSFHCGFWEGQAFSYHLLRSTASWRPTAAEAKSVGWESGQVQLDRVMRVFRERTAPLAQVARGYVGWLLTNQQFLDEHNALVAQWRGMVHRWGLDRLGILLPLGGLLPGNDSTVDPDWAEYSAAFEDFFVRWRLRGLAAPYLPVPLEPLMAGDFPVSVVQQAARAGGVFCLPDTFPIPSRDELRNLLEGSLHGPSKPEHLTEWMGIIASSNTGKKQIARFGRLFELQHYYRILHSRHPKAIRRKLHVLNDVLARFFTTTKRTIHEDLRMIRKRLGRDWIERGHDSAIGPF